MTLDCTASPSKKFKFHFFHGNIKWRLFPASPCALSTPLSIFGPRAKIFLLHLKKATNAGLTWCCQKKCAYVKALITTKLEMWKTLLLVNKLGRLPKQNELVKTPYRVNVDVVPLGQLLLVRPLTSVEKNFTRKILHNPFSAL